MFEEGLVPGCSTSERGFGHEANLWVAQVGFIKMQELRGMGLCMG